MTASNRHCGTSRPSLRPPFLRGVVQAGLSLSIAGGALGDEGPNSSLYGSRLIDIRQAGPPAPPGPQLPPGPAGSGSPAMMQAQPNGNASGQALPPNLSWYEIPLPPVKEVRVNDIITIRVDTGARMSESAQLQRRRTAQYDARLNDWIVLDGLRAALPAPQTNGDQRIQGNLQQTNRVTGQLDTAESLKFDIAASVAAVLPNGNIVLEAHREVRINNEQWMQSLSGVCRREDIGPNNTVLSKDIANLRVEKRELGQIRDSYKRGWLSKWWDQFGPF